MKFILNRKMNENWATKNFSNFSNNLFTNGVYFDPMHKYYTYFVSFKCPFSYVGNLLSKQIDS